MAPHSSTLAWKNPMDGGAWWAAVYGVAQSRTRLSDFTFTFHFHALGKEMATHSSVLAWRIPGMAEPGGLLSMASHRVRHDWSDLAAAEWVRDHSVQPLAKTISSNCLTWQLPKAVIPLGANKKLTKTFKRNWGVRSSERAFKISSIFLEI